MWLKSMFVRTLSAVVAALAVLVVSTPGARAADEAQWQFGGRQATGLDQWGMRAPDPPVTAGQMEHYASVLGMDEAQLGMAQQLHAAFRDEYMTKWLTYAEESSDAQSRAMMTQDWQAMQADASQRQGEFRESIEQLTDDLLADVRLLLTRDQEENWARLERDRRREQYLTSMSADGVRAMDLVALAGLLGLSEDEHAEIEPMLEAYAVELDGALSAYVSKAHALDDKIDRYEKQQAEMMKARQGDQPDMEKVMQAQQEFSELSDSLTDQALALHSEAERVVDVNRRHTELMARELPSHARTEFERMTSRPAPSANPWMSGDFSRFKRSLAMLENIEQTRAFFESQLSAMGSDSDERFQGVFQLMRAVEPLSPDQKREAEIISADYEREMEAVREQAARKAGRDADDEDQRLVTVPTPRGVVTLFRVDENGFGGAWMGGMNAEQDKETLEKKAEIEQRAIDRLRDVLTFYQRAAIAQN